MQQGEQVSKLQRIRKILKIVSLLWTYVTIGLFISFGVKTLTSGGEPKFLVYLIFVISFFYFIASTVLAFMNDKNKAVKKNKKKIKKAFKMTQKIIKLTFAIISVMAISGVVTWSVFESSLSTIFTIIWLFFQITLDIVITINKMILKKLIGFMKGKFKRSKNNEEESDEDDLD